MPRPAAFLDRDGTILVERHYLSDPEQVELIPGAVEGIRRLQQAGYALVLVTNQSGIGRGLFTKAEYLAVQERLEQLLEREGVHLDGVYCCPHAPGQDCECRKPGLELFRRAAAELGLDLATSVYIGDRLRDVVPAAAFGGRGILVRTGYGESESRLSATSAKAAGCEVVADLAEAATRVVQG